MPLSPSKTTALATLVRSTRALLLTCMVGLTGCQMHGNRGDQDTVQRPELGPKPDWVEATEPEAPNDVWERIRNGYQLQDEIGVNPRIERQRLWFASNPSFIESASQRGSPYIHYVVERLDERDMPMELALLPVIESAYNPLAYSRSDAVGIWQFVPATGRNFNLRQTNWYDGRRDIMASTNAALNYLTRLHDMFNGDWLLALAAYNSGEGTVSRAIERNQKLGLPTDYWNLPLPKETQEYVPKLLALSQVVMSPDAYGINLNPIANEPYFEVVEFKQHMDLSKVAEMAQVDKEEIQQLNPAFKKGVTIDGPQQVLVPSEKAELLAANLLKMKPQELVDWQEYKVRKGDSLASIANRYQLSTDTLQDLNKLKGNRLRVGQVLSIPAKPGQRPQLPDPEPQATTMLGSNRSYTVKNGDNLWSIAKQQKVDVKDLKAWNKLANNDLSLGQKLNLQAPKSSGKPASDKTATATKAKASTEKKADRQAVTYYKIQQGDSLYSIAKRFNIDLAQLQRWNPSVSHELKPGQTLTIYR